MKEERLEPLLDESGREMLTFVFVELPKYDETDERVSQLLKDWCQYFNNEELREETDKDVQFAKKILDSYQDNKVVQEMIETVRLRDIANRDEGIEIGLKRGKARGKEEVALNLIKSGFPFDQITKLTGLSPTVLHELEKKQRVSSKKI